MFIYIIILHLYSFYLLIPFYFILLYPFLFIDFNYSFFIFIFIWSSDLFLESFIFLSIIILYSLIYSLKWLIVSEFMLFFACFWSFIYFRLGSLIYFYLILFSNTCFSIPFSELIILVYSSLSLNASFIFIFISFSYFYLSSLFNIILSAFSFIFIWLLEFYYSLYSICDYFFDCIFFFTTSLHGFHVILGFLGFMIYIFMSYYGSLVLWLDGHLGYYLLSLYWHFVDFIWLIVFLLFFI